MSTQMIPGVATDGLKPADLLWANILSKPLLFPPSPHLHVAGDLPVNIAFKDQANTFTADQNYLLGSSAINLNTSSWPTIEMRHTGQGENKFVSPAGEVNHNQSADTVWSTNLGIENFRVSNAGNVAARGTLTLSGANAVISATGNDANVSGHWNVSYGVWCGAAWLGSRAHGMTFGSGGELELQASAIKRVTIGNDYTTKFYNSSGIATVLINGTAGTITTSNSSGSSVNITTNENAGYAGTPLYTDLNFCGYGGSVNGRIRMSDISASSVNSGAIQFFTRVSASTLERMRISADGNVIVGSTTDDGVGKLQVAGGITASGTINVSGSATFGNSAATGIAGDLSISRNESPDVGVLYFGASGSSYIYADSNTIGFSKPIWSVGGRVLFDGNAEQYTVRLKRSDNSGSVYLGCDNNSSTNPDFLVSNNAGTTILRVSDTGNLNAREVSVTGHVTSAIQELSTDPTGSDLASGQTRAIKNTSTGTSKFWLNDGGTFKSLTFV